MHSGTFGGLSLQTEAIIMNIWSVDVNRLNERGAPEAEGCQLCYTSLLKHHDLRRHHSAILNRM